MPISYVCELCDVDFAEPHAYWDHADTIHDNAEWERFRDYLLAQFDNPWLPPDAAGVERRTPSQNHSPVGTNL